MLPLHPLETPEIVLHIASFVPERSLLVCVRVSKFWYRAFIPFVWKCIELDNSDQLHLRPFTSTAIVSRL